MVPQYSQHYASLLHTIFASLARKNERVYVHNSGKERNFPQANFDSEMNARFLLNGRGNLHFFNA